MVAELGADFRRECIAWAHELVTRNAELHLLDEDELTRGIEDFLPVADDFHGVLL